MESKHHNNESRMNQKQTEVDEKLKDFIARQTHKLYHMFNVE